MDTGAPKLVHALRVLGENMAEEGIQNHLAQHVQLNTQIQTLLILRLEISIPVGARLGTTVLILRTSMEAVSRVLLANLKIM